MSEEEEITPLPEPQEELPEEEEVFEQVGTPAPEADDFLPAEEIPPIPEDLEVHIHDEEHFDVTADRLPDAEDLYERYYDRTMYGQRRQARLMASRVMRLKETEQLIYSEILALITEVAQGRLSDTQFVVSGKDVFDKTEYTWAELGVDEPLYYSEEYKSWLFTDEAWDVAYSYFNANMSDILWALMTDVPYEMYWFDKTAGWIPYVVNDTYLTTTGVRIGNNHAFHLHMSVCAAYSETGNRYTFVADKDKCGATLDAAANARAIVAQAQATCNNDYEILK